MKYVIAIAVFAGLLEWGTHYREQNAKLMNENARLASQNTELFRALKQANTAIDKQSVAMKELLAADAELKKTVGKTEPGRQSSESNQ